jgi:uncharacterized membrane protein
MIAETSSPRNTWFGLAIAAAIGLLAAQPLLLGRLAAGSDTYFHVHRLWQLHQLLNQGVLFSRWAPDLPFGFGYPIFNFYAPLSYYLAEVFYRLTGGLVAGYTLALVFTLVIASVAMFLWLSDLFSTRAAWVGAAAFVFAPHPISNIYSRGAIAEPLAAALMPLVLWAIHRLIKTQRVRYGLWPAAAFAALVLSHNVSAFTFTPLVALYSIALCIRHSLHQPHVGRTLLRCGAYVCIGLGWGVALAAFFAVPAFLERGYVRLELIYTAFYYDYHKNFLALSELFNGPQPVDAQLVDRTYRFFIGVIPFVGAVIGLMGLVRLRNSEQRFQIGLAALACALCIFMATFQSEFIWDAIPFLRVLQFPTRWLMPNTVFLALLIGAGCEVLMSFTGSAHAWRKTGIAVMCLTLLVINVFSMLIITSVFSSEYSPSALQIAQLEKQYSVIGTTNTGEYLPVAVKEIPPLEQSSLLRAGRRLDLTSLPPTTRVLSETYTPLTYDVTLNAPQSFNALFNTFYFPGWQASVDGAPAEINPSDPHGFIRVPVPAGQHRLQVAFGSTPIRTAATGVSAVAVLLWLACGAWLAKLRLSAK